MIMPTTTTRNTGVSKTPVVNQEVHEEAEDKVIQTVTDCPDTDSYARDLAFMNEQVEVMVAESTDKQDTTRLITLGVNGKQFFFMRGEWRTCPRYVLEMLAKAKRESWNFAYKTNPDGSTTDINTMHRVLRYPHQYRDQNPKGDAWYNSVREQHF